MNARLTSVCAAGRHDDCTGEWVVSEKMAQWAKEPPGSGPCSCPCHEADA